MKIKVIVFFCGCIVMTFASWAISENVFSHGGGLDSSGCHHNRKTGGYHCHRSYGGSSRSSRSSRKPRANKMDLTAIPKAAVYIDGKYKGVTPVKNLKFGSSRSAFEARFVHPIHGEVTRELKIRDNLDLHVRW